MKYIISAVSFGLFYLFYYKLEYPAPIVILFSVMLLLPFCIFMPTKPSDKDEDEGFFVKNQMLLWALIVYVLFTVIYVRHNYNPNDAYDMSRLGKEWQKWSGNYTANSYSQKFFLRSFRKGLNSSAIDLMFNEKKSENWYECTKWGIVAILMKERLAIPYAENCANELTEEQLLKVKEEASVLHESVIKSRK